MRNDPFDAFYCYQEQKAFEHPNNKLKERNTQKGAPQHWKGENGKANADPSDLIIFLF